MGIFGAGNLMIYGCMVVCVLDLPVTLPGGVSQATVVVTKKVAPLPTPAPFPALATSQHIKWKPTSSSSERGISIVASLDCGAGFRSIGGRSRDADEFLCWEINVDGRESLRITLGKKRNDGRD
jgi:hypothetical protein